MPAPKSKPRHPTLPERPKATPPLGTPEHDEWLVDEADEESFPASDPSAPATGGKKKGVKP